MDSLAGQLGMLRSYIGRFTLSTKMSYLGGAAWDVYNSAISNDVAQRKGPSTEAALSLLLQMIGRLEAMDQEADLSPGEPTQRGAARTVNIYNLHGPQSRVNVQSEDHSTNVSSETEQQLFKCIREAIARGVSDGGQKAEILRRLDVLETSNNSSEFLSNYQAFINVLASHMTIILPFIPALTQMLSR